MYADVGSSTALRGVSPGGVKKFDFGTSDRLVLEIMCFWFCVFCGDDCSRQPLGGTACGNEDLVISNGYSFAAA